MDEIKQLLIEAGLPGWAEDAERLKGAQMLVECVREKDAARLHDYLEREE